MNKARIKRYRYACNYHEPTVKNIPAEGLLDIFPLECRGKYADVEYSRSLTDGEIEQYKLTPIEMPPTTVWHLAKEEQPEHDSLVLIATKGFGFIGKAVYKVLDDVTGAENVFIETNVGFHDTFFSNDISYWAYIEEEFVDE